MGVTPESVISVAPDYQGPSFESGVPLDPGSVASGASASVTMTVAGAQIGDYVTASFTNDLQGCLLTADVTATNTVRIVISNLTGSPKDLAAGTVRARVQKPMNYAAY